MEPLFRTNVPPYRLGELLIRIAERRLTGRLLLTTDLGERTIYVHSGYPVFAHSSQFSERLGAIGVRYGFLKREDVAAALNLAREKSCELGRALLELGHVNGTQLFRMLGAQLVEQLAASCGGTASRARFLAEPQALDRVAILRVHPMTAVLSAVRHLPSADHGKMLAAVADRRVAAQPLAEPVKEWLADIGFLGDANGLVSAEGTTVSVLRSKLVAKLRASTQQDFDPTASPIPLDVRKEDSARPAARSVADYLTLALLLAGAVKLAEHAATDAADGGELPLTTTEGMRATLGGATRAPFGEVPEMPPTESRTVDAAIRAYLEDKREARTAARLAIWGPAAEVADDEHLEQVLALYLTLKPEANDHAALDVTPNDSPERVTQAHAKYRGFLAMLSEKLTSSLAQARIAELEKRVDDALQGLLSPAPLAAPAPISVRPASQPPAGDAARTPSAPPAARESARPRRGTPDGPGQRTSLPPEDEEALLRNVEARVREGHWQKVLELIQPLEGRGRALPPTLSLAKALAARELAPKRYVRGRVRVLVALVIGVAAGWLLARYGVVPLDLF